ncbi:hypothetical protein BH11PSE2_BH11PSE2_18290 [soil metagenome]
MIALVLAALLQASPNTVQLVKPEQLKAPPAHDPIACSTATLTLAPTKTPLFRPHLVPDKENRGVIKKLADLPDASMVRAVWRSYCNEADVIRYNVSDKSGVKTSQPASGTLGK